jgi:hypothetical protein
MQAETKNQGHASVAKNGFARQKKRAKQSAIIAWKSCVQTKNTNKRNMDSAERVIKNNVPTVVVITEYPNQNKRKRQNNCCAPGAKELITTKRKN